MTRRRLRTGDEIQSGIVSYKVLSDETRSGHVIIQSRVSGKTTAVRVDTPYTLTKAVVT